MRTIRRKPHHWAHHVLLTSDLDYTFRIAINWSGCQWLFNVEYHIDKFSIVLTGAAANFTNGRRASLGVPQAHSTHCVFRHRMCVVGRFVLYDLVQCDSGNAQPLLARPRAPSSESRQYAVGHAVSSYHLAISMRLSPDCACSLQRYRAVDRQAVWLQSWNRLRFRTTYLENTTR